MGAYSSFVSFALTHHYIIYRCCRLANKRWKSLPYALLGDHIVICDQEVAILYKETLKSLGVEFSSAKSHESLHFYEFAKRIFYKGSEVSPFPFSSLNECSKTTFMLSTLLWELKRKECWVPVESLLSSVADFYRQVLGWRRSYINKKVVRQSRLCLGVLDVAHGYKRVDEVINDFIKVLGLPLPPLQYEVCRNIFLNCIVQSFADSNTLQVDLDNTSKIPLSFLSDKLENDFYEYQQLFKQSDPNYQVLLNLHQTPISYAYRALVEEFGELTERITQ